MLMSPEHVLAMARYNAWQNRQMKFAFEALGDAALRKDRGAFFGSIFATANHILWGDMRWMSLLDGGAGPTVAGTDSVTMTPEPQQWGIERFRMDARILLWAEKLRAVDLTGDLDWYSAVLGRDVVRDKALCVAHMFNHQTHHRGQIHAMVTAAGGEGWVSDLIFMPDEGPWL